MLHNNSKPESELDLSNVILLYNQFTLDLVCNNIFTSELNKTNTKLQVQGNGVTLLVNHRSNIPGYNQTKWFSKKKITNRVSPKNTTKQYRVTYESNN